MRTKTNLTISAEADVIKRARDVARRHGTTLKWMTTSGGREAAQG